MGPTWLLEIFVPVGSYSRFERSIYIWKLFNADINLWNLFWSSSFVSLALDRLATVKLSRCMRPHILDALSVKTRWIWHGILSKLAEESLKKAESSCYWSSTYAQCENTTQFLWPVRRRWLADLWKPGWYLRKYRNFGMTRRGWTATTKFRWNYTRNLVRLYSAISSGNAFDIRTLQAVS